MYQMKQLKFNGMIKINVNRYCSYPVRAFVIEKPMNGLDSSFLHRLDFSCIVYSRHGFCFLFRLSINSYIKMSIKNAFKDFDITRI